MKWPASVVGKRFLLGAHICKRVYTCAYEWSLHFSPTVPTSKAVHHCRPREISFMEDFRKWGMEKETRKFTIYAAIRQISIPWHHPTSGWEAWLGKGELGRGRRCKISTEQGTAQCGIVGWYSAKCFRASRLVVCSQDSEDSDLTVWNFWWQKTLHQKLPVYFCTFKITYI